MQRTLSRESSSIAQKPPLSRVVTPIIVKMNTTRLRHLIAGGVLAASAILGAPTALAQPVNPDNPGDVANPDVPTNANDARCIAMPWVLACGGTKYGGVPGAFDNVPGG